MRPRMLLCFVLALGLAIAAPANSHAQSFQGLGFLPGYDGSNASDVNADGSVAVGLGSNANGTQAFRWTAATGMTGLGYLPGYVTSNAIGVNADGSVVVGSGNNPNASQAVRWTAATGMVGLG